MVSALINEKAVKEINIGHRIELFFGHIHGGPQHWRIQARIQRQRGTRRGARPFREKAAYTTGVYFGTLHGDYLPFAISKRLRN